MVGTHLNDKGIMMAKTDEVAKFVAADGARLLEHGVVRVRGYALLTTIVVVDPNAPDLRDVLRVYINPTFDRWIDLPLDKVRHQVQDTDKGPSLVWVDADAVVIYGHSGLAANIAESADDGKWPEWP